MSHGFDVGVTIHLVDKFSHGLVGISSSMKHADSACHDFAEKLGKVHTQMLAFGMLKNVGQDMFAGATSALHALIEPAKEYSHLLNMMNMQGLKQAEIQANIKSAWGTSAAMPYTSPTENLKALLDLSNFFVDEHGNHTLSYNEARTLLPGFMKSKAILQGSAEKYGMDPSEQVYAMAKSLEMIGAVNDPKSFEHEMEMMNRVAVATSGRVMPSSYQNTFKYARQAKLTMNDEFKYKVLPELIMEMQSGNGGAGGGGGPGAMIAAAMRLGVQGIMSVATAGNLAKLGLLDAPVYKTTTTGTMVKGGGGLIHANEFAANPHAWVEKYMIPAMIKQHPEFKNDPGALLLNVAQQIKGNQNAIALLQELHQKSPQLKRFGMRLDAVPKTDELYKSALKDPGVAESAFEKSMETLKVSISQNIMPILIPGIYALANAFNKVGQYFNQNPWAGKLIMSALAATAVVGAILAVVGTVGMFIAAITLFGVSIGGAIAALGSVVAIVAASIAAYTALFMAFLNLDRVTKALNRVFSQGIIIFLQVQNAFISMCQVMVGGIYGALGAANSLVRSMSFGAMGFDDETMSRFKQYGMGGLNNMKAANEAAIAKLKANPAMRTDSNRKIDMTKAPSGPIANGPVFNIAKIEANGHKDGAAAGKHAAAEFSKHAAHAAKSIASSGGHTSTGHTGAHH